MKPRTTNVTASLPLADLDMLGRFATDTVTEPASPTDRVNEARATQALLRRGFLQKPKGGTVLVTPEGLAALLDTVPIQRLTPSLRSGVSTRPSTGSRT
jgi:hypothetical protein